MMIEVEEYKWDRKLGPVWINTAYIQHMRQLTYKLDVWNASVEALMVTMHNGDQIPVNLNHKDRMLYAVSQ